MRRMIFALFIEFEAGVIGIDHSGLHMGLCDALFKFEALQYARIVVLRFIYACRDRPHPHGARLKGRIGSIRRECLDHIVVARRICAICCAYASYYNATRTHQSIDKDARSGPAIVTEASLLSEEER
jgi:hypothetical protein